MFARLPGPVKSLIRRVVEAVPPSEKKVTISFLLKRFVQGADLEGIARHQLWVSNIAPPLLQRLGVTPVNLVNRDAGAGHLLDRVQRWDLETRWPRVVDQGRPREHEFGTGTARAISGRSGDGIRKIASGRGPGAGFNTKNFSQKLRLALPAEGDCVPPQTRLSVPIGRWLRGPLHEWASAALGCGHLERLAFTRRHPGFALRTLPTQSRHARALWTLLVLNEWLDWVATETDSLSAEIRLKGPKD